MFGYENLAFKHYLVVGVMSFYCFHGAELAALPVFACGSLLICFAFNVFVRFVRLVKVFPPFVCV